MTASEVGYGSRIMLDRLALAAYDACMLQQCSVSWFYVYFTPPAELVGLLEC
jgi:hypothetical protein